MFFLLLLIFNFFLKNFLFLFNSFCFVFHNFLNHFFSLSFFINFFLFCSVFIFHTLINGLNFISMFLSYSHRLKMSLRREWLMSNSKFLFKFFLSSKMRWIYNFILKSNFLIIYKSSTSSFSFWDIMMYLRRAFWRPKNSVASSRF